MKSDWPIIGNAARLAELTRDLKANQLAHAYLFAGPAEVGKFTAARHFAHALLCPELCGSCEVCRQIKANCYEGLTIADQLWIEGVAEDWEEIGQRSNFNQLHRSKTPKAKSDAIGLEDLRAILERLHHSRDGRQIVLIRSIERFTTEAANSFLKSLEEPPPNTIFLLTTDNLPLLPETIISRCRVLQFGNVAPSAIEVALQAKFPNLAETDRNRIVNFALGKPGRALRLAADPEILTAYSEYFRRLKDLFGKPDTAARMRLAEEAAASPAETTKFLEALTYFLRSFLLTRARQPVADSRYNAAKLGALIQKTDETRHLVNRNINARLALENLLLAI